MIRKIGLLLLLLSFQSIFSQVTLTHNVGNTPIVTSMFSCDTEESWARAFTLSDFGISTTDQFIIKSGQVAVSNAYSGARLMFHFYTLDSNFPNSTPHRISYGNVVLTPLIGDAPEIVQIDFATPIVIPAGAERILVEVSQLDDPYNPDYDEVIIAGTQDDNATSWFTGCREYYTHTATENLSTPVPDANFFINVTGEIFSTTNYGSSATLTHNVCDDIIETSIHSCSSSYIYWARAFTLEDFGISTNEEFIINSGQVGINKVGWLPEISFNIYSIDENFPASFSETNLIGSSQYQELSPNIDRNSRIIHVEFDTPIAVPAGVERILVEVHKGIVYGDGLAFIAGSAQDTGESWQRGCVTGGPHVNAYVSAVDFGRPDANFYINVTGNVNHVTNNFDMNISNICSEFLKEFSLENQANIASVLWNFGDAASGATNTSTDLSPFHDFSADGTYTITATVTATNGSIELISETIDVKEPPNAYGISDITVCEDAFNTGISSSFDLSMVRQQVLGGQIRKIVTFIDGSGNEYNSLPNNFANTVRDRETIQVRVSHADNICCFSETTFDLIVDPIPNLESIEDLIVCDSETNGFALFNLQPVKENIIGTSTNIAVAFYHENGQLVNEPLNAIENLVANEEVIRVRAINSTTDCYNETTFKLKISPLPVANILNELVGCDDNNDGISEYFDTSNVELDVLGSQTGMTVSYFDIDGNLLASPLPSPYTNTTANQEIITVRVTNTQTNCYSEKTLVLKTASQPQINKPQTLYACDLGNGFASFDTSNIESELIGNQNDLKIIYFDTNGIELPSPLTPFFQNTEAWNQTIYTRVENELNSLCYTETSFDLVVNEIPSVAIEETYFLCHLEPSLKLSIDSSFDTYSWSYQDNNILSNTYEADLTNAGNYTLTVGKNTNGIYCENSFEFELKRSVLPTITEVKSKELSDDNFIEIIAAGDGEFEYSINGMNYQSSPIFNNVLGGTYTVIVRDKNGCGEDTLEVILIDYPKFFTPNTDGINDTWQIIGISNYPDALIYIYDRYGKLLKQINADSAGWNGIFLGKNMPSSDYWFKANLGNGTVLSGHFTLKR